MLYQTDAGRDGARKRRRTKRAQFETIEDIVVSIYFSEEEPHPAPFS